MIPISFVIIRKFENLETQIYICCVNTVCDHKFICLFFFEGGIPYEVVVVAYTNAGRGDENDRFGPFFTEELPPLKSVDENSISISQLNATSVNVTWAPLSLFDARGFPEYVITLALSDDYKKRQSPQSITTSKSFAVFGGLTGGSSYSAVVGTRTGGENTTIILAPSVPLFVKRGIKITYALL